MPLMEEERVTTLTVPHRRLIDLLESVGFEVRSEVAFPPKRVDCYLPQFHLAVEADGPHHSGPKDRERDAYLMVHYALPVVRLTDQDLTRSDRLSILLWRVVENAWRGSLVERRMVAYRAGADLGSGV